MKQRALLLTLVALLGIMQARAVVFINETNFPDENFRNWLLMQDYCSDGVIMNDDIAGIKSIYVGSKGIASLKGIEFFTALTTLGCEGNQLCSLDVSKNTTLESLYCPGNQLTSLDVSKNTALTYLNCNYNQLTTLNVSGCTALITLSCCGNQLTSLDVSKNTALTYLGCGVHHGIMAVWTDFDPSKYSQSNKLTSLNVSKNTALTTLECDGNHLTSLDVSNNKALTTLYCGDNQLTSLNVKNNTALTGLYCDKNQLTSLDVSNNKVLAYLCCGGNQLTSLDVSNNTVLTELECEKNQLTSLNVKNNTVLTELGCGDNQLTSLDVSKNTVLTELSFYQNKIKGSAMDALVESLPIVSNNREMYVISFNENEGNVMTTVQVAVAKAKGWEVYYRNELDGMVFVGQYAGSDPSGIEELKNSRTEGLTYYDLQGRRIMNPTKGVYIINGKKVLVK